MYDSRKRRWLLRMPRHQAESTRRPAPGNRMRTIAIVNCRLSPSNPGAISCHQERRGEHAEQHQNSRDEREQRRHRAGDARGLLLFLSRDERGIDRNERCRQRAFAEQVLQKIGNAEGRHECVGRVGQAEILGEEPLADEAGEPAAENAEGYERGGAVHSGDMILDRQVFLCLTAKTRGRRESF